MLVYLDASAVSALGDGDHAAALRRYLGADPDLVTCRIVEVQIGSPQTLAALAIREVDETLCRRAAEIKSAEIDPARALHLAAALELRRELEGFVTYDSAVAAAARALRLPVVSPT